ncbi:MAG: phosphate transport system substrate-binding protein [Solirubrobacteraceae bacterium]|nr:phosphate transport system substrate-binding protein [Solirubrobacteraceae bacterium]
MTPRIPIAVLAAGALALGTAACGSSNSNNSSTSSSSGSGSTASGTVNGAGSTFAAPVYQQWGADLKGQGLTVNYQPVGSGAGVAALAAGTAAFAGSDPSLQPADRATLKKGPVLQIPMFFGAITVSYNESGAPKDLKLDGSTIANIFLGKIKKWNDPAIAALNSGVSLPGDDITIVHRSDESGTTKGFTTYLSDVSGEWKSSVGADKTVKWPTGTGAKGNYGVAATIKNTSGSIGYVEQAYALQNGFTYADVKNSAGNFVAPTLASTSAAGNGLKIPADLGISTINAPGAQAYPIASQTFVDVYKDPCKAGVSKGDAKALKSFIDYGLTTGQDSLGKLFFAKLPAPLLAKSTAALGTLTCNGSAL